MNIRVAVTCFLVCASLISKSQPWMKSPFLKVSKSEAGYNDIRRAFYSYWGDRPYEKGKGYKQFKRWEYINAPRCFPDGRIPEADKYYKAKQHILKEFKADSSKTDYASWMPLGITGWENGPNGYNPGNGRVNVVGVDSLQSQIIYIGAPSGGLWKSTNGGTAWNTTFDAMPHLGVSAVAIHPDSSQVVFVGTGDRDAYDTPCTGLYKSTDGGNTFTPSGFNTTNAWNSINKILYNPLNPSVMFAATNYGVYKSDNRGQSWSNMYNGSWVTDLVYRPGDTTTLYGSGAFFIRSVDGGATFTANTLLPNDTIRLEIAVTPANPDYVYVVSSDADYRFGGLYRSVDAGGNFTLQSDTPNIFGYEMDGSDDAGQSWYDLAIAASPVNADEIFVGGINVWKSADGGQSWSIISHWIYDNPSFYTHADIHYLGFSGSRLFCGSDGGIFYSDDFGTNWTDISQGLGITQFYRMASSPLDPDFIVAGAQDNGSNKREGGVWTHLFGADGMQTLTDPTDINTYYFSYQSGGLMRTNDNGVTIDYIMPNDSNAGAWITPFTMHPQYNSVLYAGFDDVYMSFDAGDSWDKISDSLAGGECLSHLKVASSNPDYIYAAYDDNLYISKNSGLSWTTKKVPFTGIITDIAIAYDDPEKLWLTASGSNGDRVYKSLNAGQTLQNMTYNISGTGVRSLAHMPGSHDALYAGTENAVFYIDNTLTQWVPFFSGLPNAIVNQLEINFQAQKIRAATYGRGIWESPLYPVSGVDEVAQSKPFAVYPNPSPGIITLDLSALSCEQVHLFDINGRHIQTTTPAAAVMQINMQHLVSGVYFIRLDCGRNKYFERIVLLNSY